MDVSLTAKIYVMRFNESNPMQALIESGLLEAKIGWYSYQRKIQMW